MEKKDRKMILLVEDNGVGMPETAGLDNSTGFGLQLVGLLAAQLRGTVRLERDGGTRIALEFGI